MVLHKEKRNKKTRCVCKTRMPLRLPFFEKCNLFYLTLTFADDLDLVTSRCILMRYAFIPNMSLVSKLV